MSADRHTMRALLVALAVTLAVLLAPAAASANVDPAFTGWGTVTPATASASTAAAWQWTGATTGWKAQARAAGTQVYLQFFATGWEWTWTSDAGWLAMRAVDVSGGSSCTGVNVAAGASIQAAIDANPAGATICLGAGTHRLGAPLTIKSGDHIVGAGRSTGGTTVIGSQRIATWTPSGGRWYASGVLPAAYAGAGECEDTVGKPCQQYEDLYRGGDALRRVTSAAALTSGTFYADYAANRVWVTDDPTGAAMEIGHTRAFDSGSGSNVEIRGLVIRQFASASQRGTVVLGAGWNVHDVDIRTNHGIGFMILGSASRITDSLVFNNGQLGGGAYNVTDFLVRNVEMSYNNYLNNYWVHDWESGGFKTTVSTGLVDASYVHDNHGVGLWADVNAGRNGAASGLEFRNSRIVRNSADGIRYEISFDGTIDGNTITGNGCDVAGRRGNSNGGLYDGAGININTSSNVQIFGNTLAGNVNAIGGNDRARGGGAYGAWHLDNVAVHDNSITPSRCSNGYGLTGLVANSGVVGVFSRSHMRFDANRYHFLTADGGLAGPRFAWNGSITHTWSTWRTVDGQDVTGTADVA